jgi:C4-type Zn-finger protein
VKRSDFIARGTEPQLQDGKLMCPVCGGPLARFDFVPTIPHYRCEPCDLSMCGTTSYLIACTSKKHKKAWPATHAEPVRA